MLLSVSLRGQSPKHANYILNSNPSGSPDPVIMRFLAYKGAGSNSMWEIFSNCEIDDNPASRGIWVATGL